MKKVLPFAFVIWTTLHASAQNWEMVSNLNYAKATGNMARNINDAVGITLGFEKKCKNAFSFGAELATSTYGNQKTRQQYTFDDGAVTETDVLVSNNFTSLSFTSKYFLRNEKKVNPYVSAKMGWSWFNTTLTIEDPDDKFSCHPLESDILAKDNTYVISAGAGVRVDFSSLFKKMDADRFYFDFNTHVSQEGTIKYMNVEKDPSQAMPDQDVMAKFVNTQTQVIHEHHVGYLYNSMINMIEYRLGVVFRIGGK